MPYTHFHFRRLYLHRDCGCIYITMQEWLRRNRSIYSNKNGTEVPRASSTVSELVLQTRMFSSSPDLKPENMWKTVQCLFLPERKSESILTQHQCVQGSAPKEYSKCALTKREKKAVSSPLLKKNNWTRTQAIELFGFKFEKCLRLLVSSHSVYCPKLHRNRKLQRSLQFQSKDKNIHVCN